MHDDLLKKIAATGAIAGLMGLFAISLFFPEEDLATGHVIIKERGESIVLDAHVVSVDVRDQATVLTVTRDETLDVFVQEPLDDVSTGDDVRIEGRVGEYNGKKEIIATRITR